MFNQSGLTKIVLPPANNAFAGTQVSDYVNMKNFQHAGFKLIKGIGTTGTSTVTVQKASDAAGTGAEAIPFKYRRIAADGTAGSYLDAPAAGFTTTAGSEDTYEIEVSTSLEGLADSANAGNKSFVAVKAVEVVASAVAGCIIVELEGARYGYNDSSS